MDVPAQSRSAAGGCTRCGRPDIWHVCSSCTGTPTTVGSPSSVTMSSGTPWQHPTAHCAACRTPLSLPPRYHTTHVLCPPCQAHHATLFKPNHPRANPYPVVPPIATSLHAHGVGASTVAYTYPQLRVLAPPLSPSPSPSPTWLEAGAGHANTISHVHPSDGLRVCLRFGCGARLPVHVRGDMCEGCLRARFVRPPPAVLPKRVPRRATERVFHWPHKSLDLSLLRSHAQDTPIVRDREENVEDELELDLVYPDDVATASQSVPTTTDPKNEEPDPAEDDDDELELVYPEDTAEAAQKVSSKPQIKASAPTTLRELFTHGLQTIPTLQNLAAISDETSPRRCRMPGCNETLPAHTCMERCVKCSIDDWKRRKLASVNTSDQSRHPTNTSPLTTDTSMEATEVTTMPVDTSEVEDGNELPLPSSSPKSTSDELAGEHESDIRYIPGWDSDLTELSSSDSECVSDSDPDPGPIWQHEDTMRPTIRIPLLVYRLPPNCSLQKCGNKRCNIALPKDYRWKTCDPCRRAQRRYQAIRLENKRRSVLGLEPLELPNLSCHRWRSLSPEVHEPDVTLTPETSRRCSAGRCSIRIPLAEVYQWKTCTRCRARARRKARRKRDSLIESLRASAQTEVVPRFPEYQNRETLVSSFDAQLKGFVEGQLVYLRAKLHEDESRKPKDVPMVFIFVGEYSLVTGQRDDRNDYDHDEPKAPDDPAELEAMRREVSSVVLALERVLRTTFRAGEAFAIDKGGIIMRFTCELQLIAQLRPLMATVDPHPGPHPDPELTPVSNSTSTSSADKDKGGDGDSNVPVVPLVKTLRGELEAVVVPDESHRLFRGRRTVIRYCMLG